MVFDPDNPKHLDPRKAPPELFGDHNMTPMPGTVIPEQLRIQTSLVYEMTAPNSGGAFHDGDCWTLTMILEPPSACDGQTPRKKLCSRAVVLEEMVMQSKLAPWTILEHVIDNGKRCLLNEIGKLWRGERSD